MTRRVLIVGLRREQTQRLRDKFPNIDIQVLGDQDLHHKPVKNANLFDKIISLTKFTNHSTHTNYKKYDSYTMTAGGYSSVVNILAEVW